MDDIVLNLKESFIEKDELLSIKPEIIDAYNTLYSKSESNNSMAGWINYTKKLKQEEIVRIKKYAKKIQDTSDVLIILGIGGSYLGAKSSIEAIKGNFYNELSDLKIYFAGQNLSGAYLKDLIEIIKNKDISVIVISKSGTTLETALSFRVIRDLMISKYKDKASERIFSITDKCKGALKNMSNKNSYESFEIPDDVGGRYSVITPVGLLPIACAGLDIDLFLKGLKSAEEEYLICDFEKNICFKYVAARNILSRKGKDIEILVNYDPSNSNLSKWWIQLFGESEGKDGKGIYPSNLDFTTDLHSMGQYVQEGKKNLFETTIKIKSQINDMTIPYCHENFDNLNYISNRTFSEVNEKAFLGTILAHKDGDVPGIIIEVPVMNEYYLAKLYYFFMVSCAISGYVNGIDPFTQPGVEAYKKNMYELLGKSI